MGGRNILNISHIFRSDFCSKYFRFLFQIWFNSVQRFFGIVSRGAAVCDRQEQIAPHWEPARQCSSRSKHYSPLGTCPSRISDNHTCNGSSGLTIYSSPVNKAHSFITYLDRCARGRRKHQPKKTEALKFEGPCTATARNESSKVEGFSFILFSF